MPKANRFFVMQYVRDPTTGLFLTTKPVAVMNTREQAKTQLSLVADEYRGDYAQHYPMYIAELEVEVP